jgi:hypothetical protein
VLVAARLETAVGASVSEPIVFDELLLLPDPQDTTAQVRRRIKTTLKMLDMPIQDCPYRLLLKQIPV